MSAPTVAKERNIEISEVTCESLDEFQTLITLTVTTEAQTRALSGTLFAGDAICLIEIDGPVSEEKAKKVRAISQVVRAVPLIF